MSVLYRCVRRCMYWHFSIIYSCGMIIRNDIYAELMKLHADALRWGEHIFLHTTSRALMSRDLFSMLFLFYVVLRFPSLFPMSNKQKFPSRECARKRSTSVRCICDPPRLSLKIMQPPTSHKLPLVKRNKITGTHDPHACPWPRLNTIMKKIHFRPTTNHIPTSRYRLVWIPVQFGNTVDRSATLESIQCKHFRMIGSLKTIR